MARDPAGSFLAIRGKNGEDNGPPLCTLMWATGQKADPNFRTYTLRSPLPVVVTILLRENKPLRTYVSSI